MSIADIRRACRAYAERFIGVMTRGVQAPRRLRRLGPPVPHDELPATRRTSRARSASSSSRGSSTRARSRCTGASTAAPRSPKPRSSTTITRRRRSTSSSRSGRRRARPSSATRVPALAGRDVSVLIWTTTPWTIPSNLAIAFHPEFDYAAYDVDGRAVIVAEGLAETRRQRHWTCVRHAGCADEGRGARGPAVPASAVRARSRSAVLADYVTLDAGHGRGAHGARPRRRRLPDRRQVRPRDLRADRAGRSLPRDGRAVWRPARVRRQPERRAGAAASAAGSGTARRSSHQYPHCWRCHNPVIFLATSQWFVRLDGDAGDRRARTARRGRCATRRGTPSITR